MLKVAQKNFKGARVADTALAASRQVWLAGLGAAVVTRQWASNDAGDTFRSLVKEGEVLEGHARRVLGRQVDNSVALATSLWNSARHTAVITVNGLVDAAAAALPRFRAPAAAKAKPVPVKSKRRSTAKSTKPRVARRSPRKG